jgi:hypothetical protein
MPQQNPAALDNPFGTRLSPMGDKGGEPPQILSDGGKNKLILGASRAAQSKPTEPQDAIEVREPPRVWPGEDGAALSRS